MKLFELGYKLVDLSVKFDQWEVKTSNGVVVTNVKVQYETGEVILILADQK